MSFTSYLSDSKGGTYGSIENLVCRFTTVAERAWHQRRCCGTGTRCKPGNLGALGKRDKISNREKPCRTVKIYKDSNSALFLPRRSSLPSPSEYENSKIYMM